MLLATRYENCSLKNRQKHPKFEIFFGDFSVNNFHILSLRARKNDFFHRNNVRNVFSNIELPLGHNIMTLEYVLERNGRKSQKACEKS